MTKKLVAINVLLLLTLMACGKPISSVETIIPEYSEKPNEQGVSCETSHSWDGDSLKFECETMGISVEFPSEWASLVNIYEEGKSIKIDVIQGWDATDATSGFIAKIYCFTKYDWENSTENIPVELYDDGNTYVMAENDDSVIVLYVYGGLVNYKDNKAPGFAEYQEISQSLRDGKYHAYFS